MKQTAVEWLIEQFNLQAYTPHIEQAKQMERNQIIDAWEDGAQTEHKAKVNGKADSNSFHYYNETYKNKQ